MQENFENPWIVGDIIQIDPQKNDIFGGCLMFVTTQKTWGAQGYVLVPDHPTPKRAFLNLPHGNGVKIGCAEWLILDKDQKED